MRHYRGVPRARPQHNDISARDRFYRLRANRCISGLDPDTHDGARCGRDRHLTSHNCNMPWIRPVQPLYISNDLQGRGTAGQDPALCLK